ncbi:MAG: transposase [Panacagrimonas sp.]
MLSHIRSEVERVFAWAKDKGRMRRARYCGVQANGVHAHLLGIAWNARRAATVLAR